MTKLPALKPIMTCGCANCLCRRGPRCHCEAYNELLDLVCWDLGRTLYRPLYRRSWNLESPHVPSITLYPSPIMKHLDTINAACLLAFALGSVAGFLLAA